MKAAVLFLIFNRPAVTERVFSEIRKARPPRLYIAADGPRKERPQEKDLCSRARKVVEQIDWPCEVFTLFRNENLGCKKAVSTGITWFFDKEEEGIILEDDCLPDPTFFSFCEIMLERYRNDSRVVHIGGTNFQDGVKRGTGDYYFSNISHVWGWASWRRSWKNYDVTMARWPEFKRKKELIKLYGSARIVRILTESFDLTYENKIDTWDYQLTLSNLLQEGLSIVPNNNLVSNLGYAPDATHTTHTSSFSERPLKPMEGYEAPEFVRPEKEADIYTFVNALTFKAKLKFDLAYWMKRIRKGISS